MPIDSLKADLSWVSACDHLGRGEPFHSPAIACGLSGDTEGQEAVREGVIHSHKCARNESAKSVPQRRGVKAREFNYWQPESWRRLLPPNKRLKLAARVD